jgi:hypothetical protein
MNSEPIYIRLAINPEAQYEWDKICIQNPLDGSAVTLEQIIAERVQRSGTHLARLDLSIEIIVSEKPPQPSVAHSELNGAESQVA